MIDVQRAQCAARFGAGVGSSCVSACATTQPQQRCATRRAAATAASAMPSAATAQRPRCDASAHRPRPSARPRRSGPAAAPAATPPAPGAPRPFAEVIKDAKQVPGFLPIWQKDDRTWIEIAPEQLDKPFFLVDQHEPRHR